MKWPGRLKGDDPVRQSAGHVLEEAVLHREDAMQPGRLAHELLGSRQDNFHRLAFLSYAMRLTLDVRGSNGPREELCLPDDDLVDGFECEPRRGSPPRGTCRCGGNRLSFEGRDEVAAGLAVVVAVDGTTEGVRQQRSGDRELLGQLQVELALGDERNGVRRRIVVGRLQRDILAVRGVAFLDPARKKVERGQAVGLGRIEGAAAGIIGVGSSTA